MTPSLHSSEIKLQAITFDQVAYVGSSHRSTGSWLNQIEIWFGILTRSALRHRSFDSVRHLATALYKFARHWNEQLAHPFEWTYTGKVLRA